MINTRFYSKLGYRFACLVLVLFLSLMSVFFTVGAVASSAEPSLRGSQPVTASYLPSVLATESPAGSYYCYEYEFGLIWSADVITLNVDGTSEYSYCHPYGNLPTGTWVYTSSIRQVGFTNFRWVTTTYEAPDRLWAWRYLPYAGFEIGISCFRQEAPSGCSSGRQSRQDPPQGIQ